jgi:hypothetical protein
MKCHIKAHGLDTAMGVDGFSYKDYLAIPNDKLLEFFLYCLRNQEMPRILANVIGHRSSQTEQRRNGLFKLPPNRAKISIRTKTKHY